MLSGDCGDEQTTVLFLMGIQRVADVECGVWIRSGWIGNVAKISLLNSCVSDQQCDISAISAEDIQ